MMLPHGRRRYRAIPKHTHDLFSASFGTDHHPAPMSTPPRVPMDVRLACQASLMAFMAHFDADEFAQMARYFAPDGIWVRADGTLSGLPALQAWAAQRRPGEIFVRHVLSNLRFEGLSDGRVRIHSYVTVYRHDGSPDDPRPASMNGPALVGRYIDDLVLHEGLWKIHHKSVQVDFRKA
jgi:hypothetical protein